MDEAENIVRLVRQQEQHSGWLARCLKGDTGFEKPTASLRVRFSL